MSNWYDPGTGEFLIVDGAIVERDALRIAEAIKAYDENLELLCLDPDRAVGVSDAPFVVAERGQDNVLRPFMKVWQLDETIIHRIWQSDNNRFDQLQRVEKMEADQKKASQQRYSEFREEAKDIVAHIAGMKSNYTAELPGTGEKVKFFDDRPAERL